MARRQQSRGACAFCERQMTKGGLSRHLASCTQRQQAMETANRRLGKQQKLYHLQLQDAWQGTFWLHLEMNGAATLEDLDDYLRAIWLECCGHLSQFSIGGWTGQEIPKTTRAERVFQPGVEFTHIYDFGTSTETLVKVVSIREGKPLTKYPIALMARNQPPVVSCMECDQPASWLCMECMYEEDKSGTLCDAHVAEHPHEDYGDPVQLWNSPRVGECGYDGPAEPPY